MRGGTRRSQTPPGPKVARSRVPPPRARASAGVRTSGGVLEKRVKFRPLRARNPAGSRASRPAQPYCARIRVRPGENVKIIILGAGQVGSTAAQQLAREQANDVTVVDTRDEVLRDLQDRLDISTVSGNAAHPSTLLAAGSKGADLLVALTSSDEVNMIACQIAWTLFRTPTKIARIRSGDYYGRPELFGENAIPVDLAISPEQLVTDYVERLIRYPGALQVLEFAEGRVLLVGMRALKGGKLVGHQLHALRTHIPNTEVRVAAIYRNGRSILPEGDTTIEEHDEVFFVAAREDMRIVMKEFSTRGGDRAPRRDCGRGQHRLPARARAGGPAAGQADRAQCRFRAARRRAAAQYAGAHRQRGRRGPAARGEHRRRGRVRRRHQRRGGEHPLRHARQEAGRAAGDGADQQAVLRGTDGGRPDRHRDLAADHHDRRAARARAPRRRRARALAAPRRRRGDGGDRPRGRAQLADRRQAHRGRSTCRRGRRSARWCAAAR